MFTIYIPIWLDLLLIFLSSKNNYVYNLHSNMVRFIIEGDQPVWTEKLEFTFQYG